MSTGGSPKISNHHYAMAPIALCTCNGVLCVVAIVAFAVCDASSEQPVGSLLDLHRQFASTKIESFSLCIASLTGEGDCERPVLYWRDTQADLLSVVTPSLETVLDPNRSECMEASPADSRRLQATVICSNSTANNSWKNVTNSAGLSTAAGKLLAEARLLKAGDAYQLHTSRPYSYQCATGELAVHGQRMLHIVRKVKALLRRIAACLAQGSTAVKEADPMAGCEPLEDAVNATMSKLTKLEETIAARMRLSQLQCRVANVLKRTGDLIQSTVQALRPQLQFRYNLSVSLARIFCYGLSQARESQTPQLCCKECADAIPALTMLPYFHGDGANFVPLLETSIRRHCLSNSSVANSSCVLLTSERETLSEVHASQSPALSQPVRCTPNYCMNLFTCDCPFKLTADKEHWYGIPTVSSWINNFNSHQSPDWTYSFNATTAFQCGVACTADSTSAVFVISMVTYFVALVVTVYMLYVVITRRSRLYLGRRLSGWLCLVLICAGTSTPLSLTNMNCNADGTVRVHEPKDFNLCTVMAFIQTACFLSTVPLVLGMAYSFYQLIRLSERMHSIKPKLIEHAYKVELAIAAITLCLCIPLVAVASEYKLVKGHSSRGQCFITTRAGFGIIIFLSGLAGCISIATVVAGLPKFLRLAKISQKIRSLRGGITGSFRSDSKNRQKARKIKRKHAVAFVIEVFIFIFLLFAMTAVIFVLDLLGYVQRHSHEDYYKCSLVSCTLRSDCGMRMDPQDSSLDSIYIAMNLFIVSFSWWTFRREYYMPLFDSLRRMLRRVMVSSKKANNKFVNASKTSVQLQRPAP